MTSEADANKLIIMIPDHYGRSVTQPEGSRRCFMGRLLDEVAEIIAQRKFHPVTVLSVVNYSEEKPDSETQANLEHLGRISAVDVVKVPSCTGLVMALLEGYRYIVNNHPGATVVRLDTAENPVDWIERMAFRAVEIDGMAVGQMTHNQGQMPHDSPEYYHDRCVTPMVWSRLTPFGGDNMRLRGTHGFQAFAPYILYNLLPYADLIHRHTYYHAPDRRCVRWGLDGLMAAVSQLPRRVEGSSQIQSTPLQLVDIPAIAGRNRALEKLNDQLESAMIITQTLQAWRDRLLMMTVEAVRHELELCDR